MNRTHSGKYNLLMNYILLAANFLFPLITYPYVTRVLGADVLGTVGFANSIANYFGAIATFGITSYAVRTCARIKHDKNMCEQTASELFTANAVTTFLSVILFIALVLFIPTIRMQWKYMLVFGFGFATDFIGIAWFYTATEQFSYITLRNISLKILTLLFTFWLVRDESDGLVYAGITVFFTVGINVLNFLCARKEMKIRFAPSSPFRSHYHKTKWFFVQSIALTLLSNMDVTMLGFLSSGVQTGNYEVANKIKLLLSSLVSSLGNVFLPRLSRNYAQKDMDAYWNTVYKSLRYNCVISLPMIGFLWLCAEEIILIFCGNEYVYAADILKILVIAVFVVGISTVTGIQILMSIDKEKGLFWSFVVGSAVNLVVNLLIIPGWKGAGAAIATVIAETVILVVQLFFLKRCGISLPMLKIIYKPFIAALLAFAVSFGIGVIWQTHGILNVLVMGVSYGCVYGVVLWVFREEIFTEMLDLLFGRKNGR